MPQEKNLVSDHTRLLAYPCKGNEMSIPDYQTLMLPLLKAVSDGKVHTIGELYQRLSDEFALTEEERMRTLPSGRETIIKNRISWARTYFKKAGLVSSPEKGEVKITSRGRDVLKDNPKKIDNIFLRKFDEFVEFRPRTKEKPEQRGPDIEEETPEERLNGAYQEIRDKLASDLLDAVKNSSPYFFEQLVVDLMVALGYGGSRREAGKATQRSNDRGVDGAIREDKLGLDTIYLQAKRYTTDAVGVPELREFAGALQAMRAKKGVFITTSNFTKDAIQFVDKIESKIVLIDGKRLVELMIDHDVGVSAKEIYSIKQLDSDYFDNLN
jgi:restriction system protein